MSYRCQVCDTIVPSGSPLRKHVVYRSVKGRRVVLGVAVDHERKEIAREIPCCPVCLELLDAGMPMAIVVRNRRTVVAPPEQPAVVKREAQVQMLPVMKPVALPIGRMLPVKKRKA